MSANPLLDHDSFFSMTYDKWSSSLFTHFGILAGSVDKSLAHC
jgi:hypothetical protein